ncbi:MAG: acyltransferase family protein [Candidatus Cloacimonetes bacterium]|nr:acyltransferase family protein [Candidatus Cloacimonadota bacterium]
MNNRKGYIDVAKGIGILLVVTGHCDIASQLVRDWIYTFHMPLFFFLSGLIFNELKYKDNFSLLLKSRLHSLIIPYFLIGILTYLLWLVIGRNFGIHLSMSVPWWKPGIGTLFVLPQADYMIHNIALWFLPALFVATIFYYCIYKAAKTKTALILLLLFMAILSWLDSFFPHFYLIGCINIALAGVVFLGIAHYLHVVLHISFPSSRWKLLLLLLIFAALCVLCFYLNGSVSMRSKTFHNPLLFYLGAFSGTYMVLFLSLLLPEVKILQYLGKNSIGILGFHQAGFSFTSAMIKILLKTDYLTIKNSLAGHWLYFIVSLIFSLIVWDVLKRLIPWLSKERR